MHFEVTKKDLNTNVIYPFTFIKYEFQQWMNEEAILKGLDRIGIELTRFDSRLVDNRLTGTDGHFSGFGTVLYHRLKDGGRLGLR